MPLLLRWYPEKRQWVEAIHPGAQDASGMVRGLALRPTLDALPHHERATRLAHWGRPGRQPLLTVTAGTAVRDPASANALTSLKSRARVAGYGRLRTFSLRYALRLEIVQRWR